MEMNKSKLMQFVLEIILVDSFLLTAENLQNAYFIQYLWDLKTGGSMYTKSMLSCSITLSCCNCVKVGNSMVNTRISMICHSFFIIKINK
jgi:hypothetical protein